MSNISNFTVFSSYPNQKKNSFDQYVISYAKTLNVWDAMMYNNISISNNTSENAIYVRGFSFKNTLKIGNKISLYAALSVESRKEDVSTKYDTEVSLCYKCDTEILIIDKKSTTNGDIEFTGLIPNIPYYVISHDPSNTYQDKAASLSLELDPSMDAVVEIIDSLRYNGVSHIGLLKINTIDQSPIVSASSVVGVPSITNVQSNIYKINIPSASKYYNFSITIEESRNGTTKTTVKSFTNITSANDMSSVVTADYAGSNVTFTVAVNMGIPDSIKYYHSLTTMNISSMPAPDATIYSSVYTANYGYTSQDHYIRFGVVSGGVETISPEFKITKDPLWSNVIFYAPFESDFSDKSTSNISSTNVGSCYINSTDGAAGLGCLIAPANGYIKSQININPGTSAFCIELYYKPLLPYDNFVGHGLFSFDTADGQTYSLFQLISMTGLYWGTSQVSKDGSTWTQIQSGLFFQDKWNHIAFTYSSPNGYLYVNGNYIGGMSLSASAFTQKGQFSYFGKIASALTSQSTCAIQHVRITKGNTRYINGSSFTIPKRFI